MTNCNLSNFYFLICALAIISKKSLPNSKVLKLLPEFSSKRFIVLILTLSPMIYFDSIFVYHARKVTIFFHVGSQFSQHLLLKRLSYPHGMFFELLSFDNTCKSLVGSSLLYFIGLYISVNASITVFWLL